MSHPAFMPQPHSITAFRPVLISRPAWVEAELAKKTGYWPPSREKVPNISRGSVATYLRCGGIFSDDFITNFLLSLTVKDA